tara:strand:+ start:1938 stop:2273 length:336 start_codon:yes stop_codon:yes gene_type:complete
MSFRPKQFVQRLFRDQLKKEILDNDLYDTGAMYESIDVNVTVDELGVMYINIYSVDYLKYHWDRFNLEDFVYRGSGVELAYRQWAAWMLEKFPNLQWNLPAPKVIVNLNEF